MEKRTCVCEEKRNKTKKKTKATPRLMLRKWKAAGRTTYGKFTSEITIQHAKWSETNPIKDREQRVQVVIFAQILLKYQKDLVKKNND